MTPPDRTYLAVRRHLEAMHCDHYEIGIRDRDGKMLIRNWSQDETLKSVAWLKRENAKGADIYVRPAGDKNQGLILVDDLNQATIARMKHDDYAPAAVVETSPLNYQAWVRLTNEPLAPELATAVSKAMAKRYEADLNSADWRHFGRLAGFTNRKPVHALENGHNPWVLCHEANGRQAAKGTMIIEKAKKHIMERAAHLERKTRLEAIKTAPERVYGRDPVREYQSQLKRLETRFGASMDTSRADFMICKDMAKKGYKAKQIETALQAASPELPTRKLGHEADYCQRTVKAAFADEGVKQHLSLELSRTRSSGMSL